MIIFLYGQKKYWSICKSLSFAIDIGLLFLYNYKYIDMLPAGVRKFLLKDFTGRLHAVKIFFPEYLSF